jgi:Ca2+-binding RTX toxin-like protein
MSVAVKALKHAKIAMLNNPLYVDGFSDADELAEPLILRDALRKQGHIVDTFVDIGAFGLNQAFQGMDVVVVPELENAPFPEDQSSRAEAFQDFVGNGGTLIVHGTTEPYNADFLNFLFGTSILSGGEYFDDEPFVLTDDASNTSFADDKAQITANGATATLNLASLPDHALSLYDNGTDTAVAAFGFGRGQVIFLGWDWFLSIGGINDDQDGGWYKLLRSAVSKSDGKIVGTNGGDFIDPFVTVEGQALTSDYDDRVYGRGGADQIFGDRGDDRLYGGTGDDALKGGGNFDLLNGGKGNDTISDFADGSRMFGQGGSDTFSFNDPDVDFSFVQDFKTGIDRILLNGLFFDALPDGLVPASLFHKGAPEEMGSAVLAYLANGFLIYDADGAGAVEPTHIIAKLVGHPVLKASDIEVEDFT